MKEEPVLEKKSFFIARRIELCRLASDASLTGKIFLNNFCFNKFNLKKRN
jgi:hypothetical protein